MILGSSRIRHLLAHISTVSQPMATVSSPSVPLLAPMTPTISGAVESPKSNAYGQRAGSSGMAEEANVEVAREGSGGGLWMEGA